MNKITLTYEKIADITLEIDLHNGYKIIAPAKYNSETKKYVVKFYIKDDLVDDLMVMEEFEDIEFNGNKKFISSNILKYVSKHFERGNFNKYITRCEYYQKCFERGDEIFRDEQNPYKVTEKAPWYDYYYCPNPDCGDYVEIEHEFCPHCRKLLDWSDIE